jgi:hypothetical protein
VLPPLIHVDGSSFEASTIRWLLEQLVKEVTANRPGGALASKQLAQLLFVQIIRLYLASSKNVTAGWLRALNDVRMPRRCALCTGRQVAPGVEVLASLGPSGSGLDVGSPQNPTAFAAGRNWRQKKFVCGG